MRFYNSQHQFYAGIDLHARKMYLCIIGNAHLKWAFSEAAVLFLRNNEPAKKMQQHLTSRYGKGKALSLIAQKLGRTVYFKGYQNI